LNHKDNQEMNIDYDVLILATGFTYSEPFKDEKSITLNAR
jgi:lysine/ornithine N-monooxygenase